MSSKVKRLMSVVFVALAVVLQPFSGVQAAVLNPKVYIDSPTANAVIKSNYSVSGWALNSSGVKAVNILVDGRTVGQASLEGFRPDVNKAYPGYPSNNNSGYSYTLDISSIKSGVHTIQVQAVGNNGTKVTQNVSVKIDRPVIGTAVTSRLAPKLSVDSPKANASVRNNFSVNGWALNASGIKSVDVLVDGKVVGQATLGGIRTDVNKAFPGYPNGDKSGFNYTLDIAKINPGLHTLQVQAIGVNGTKVVQNVPFKVDVLKSRISVDRPALNAIVKNNVGINGWALNAAGIKKISVMVDGVLAGNASIGIARTDVNKAYPGYLNGDKSGFTYLLDITAIAPGSHTIQVLAEGNDGSKNAVNIPVTIEKLKPLISLESPKPDEVMKNDLSISGWALNASGVKQINILVDGKAVGLANTGLPRQDVNNAFPGYRNGDKGGFNYKLGFDSITMGDHIITIQALGYDTTKSEVSVKVNRGNAFVTYKSNDTVLSEFIDKQMTRTPALQVKNENGFYEWRYAQIKDGQEGYFIYVPKKDDAGNIVKDVNGNTVYVESFIASSEQYQAIKQELINSITPEKLASDNNEVYQFIKLSYADVINADALNTMFESDGVLAGKGQVFIDAAKKYNVNPIYLAAHSILETNNGKSALAKGIAVNGVTVYNLFGIGAVDSAADAAGAQTALKYGWDSIDKAIDGGAKWIASGYIEVGQDTLYTMRWNPSNTYHQYATDIKWASNQTENIKTYFDLFKDVKLIFEIPQYK